MAKIVSSASGPLPPDPDQPQPVDGRKVVYFFPNPKASAQKAEQAHHSGAQSVAQNGT